MSKKAPPPKVESKPVTDVMGFIPLAMMEDPKGNVRLGTLLTPNGEAAPFGAGPGFVPVSVALLSGVLFGRGWNPIHVSEAEIQASERGKDPLAS